MLLVQAILHPVEIEMLNEPNLWHRVVDVRCETRQGSHNDGDEPVHLHLEDSLILVVVLEPAVHQPQRVVPDLLGKGEDLDIEWCPLQFDVLGRHEVCQWVRLEEVIDSRRHLWLPLTSGEFRLRRCLRP